MGVSMAPLILALLTLFGGLADPGPQRGADDYPVQVALWRTIASRMVDLVDEVVTRDEIWGVVVAPPGRQDWWDRITALADSAPRPTPSDGPTSYNQEHYSAAVAPVRAGLNSLAMAMRTARRDDARVALDSLRQYLPAEPPSGACRVPASDRPLRVGPSDPSIGDYIEQSVRAFETDPWVQAYALGWRCDPADPTEFLRRYWANRLARDGDRPSGQLLGEDWTALYGQATRQAREDGAATVQTAFVLRSDLASLSPAEANAVHLRLYRAAISPLFGEGTEPVAAPQCAPFRVLFQPTLQDTPGAFFRLARIALQSPQALQDANWASCVGSVTAVWSSGFQTVDRWTPPPQCQAFHARLREGLSLLAGATAAISTALQNPTWMPADLLGYVATSRTLAAAGAQGINDAVALDPNRNCW